MECEHFVLGIRPPAMQEQRYLDIPTAEEHEGATELPLIK